MNKLAEPKLVLVQPELPENIGFCVRAMECFGWKRLALVGIPAPDPSSAAYRTATLGKEILERAEVCATLDEALADCTTTVAFTRRVHARPLSPLPRAAARLAAAPGAWGLVFGRESIGLTAEETAVCDDLCVIRTAHPRGSLNLGQAVATALAAIHEARLEADETGNPGIAAAREEWQAARHDAREEWVRQVVEGAEHAKLLHPARLDSSRRHLIALLRRLRPSEPELRFLDGIWRKISKSLPKP